MTRARVLFLVLLILPSACAPVMLGRTPTPAAPGVREMSVSGGYPVGLTVLPPRVDSFGPDLAYWPVPLPLTFQIAYGRSETLETNLGLMVSPGIAGSVASGNIGDGGALNIGARYGVKNRFQKEPIELAFDYGGSLYLTNVGVDAGVLAAVPLGDAKVYGGLRGFGVFPGGPKNLGGAAALTVGGELPLNRGQRVRLELTLLTNLYNGADYLVANPADPSANAPQRIGFSLVPAIGFTF